MTAVLKFCIVRIYSNSGKVIGAGCLVSQKYILTCAHVVADALGLCRKTSEMPDALITLDFPLLAARQYLKAKVVFWRPVNPDAEAEDIAGLELENPPLQMAQSAKFITSNDLWGHHFRVFGFPSGQPNGISATGVLRQQVANGWVQLEDIKETGYRFEPGFSGAPIWDEELQGFAGIAVAAETKRLEAKAAFMIPASVLDTAWNEVNAVSQELLKELADYSSKVMKHIFYSYNRNRQIDQKCQEYLLKRREERGLLSSDTANVENELLELYNNLYKTVESNVTQFEQAIVDFFIENSLKEFEMQNMQNMLDEQKCVLELNSDEISAARTLSLSFKKCGYESLSCNDTKKAIFFFQQALNYNYFNIEAHFGLGSAYLRDNEFWKAIKAFQELKEIKKQQEYSEDNKEIKKINILLKKAKIIFLLDILVKIFRVFSIRIIFIILSILSKWVRRIYKNIIANIAK